MTDSLQPTALVTGASKGLGLALATALAERGWCVVVDARHPGDAVRNLAGVTVVPGDVSDPLHRADLIAAVTRIGRLDLLVNNASELGPSPLPKLADLSTDALRRIHEVNVIAPLALTQGALPLLRATRGVLVNVSSDAAAEAYECWGGYGSAKAALDHASAVLAREEPEVAVYAVDPGDMRTDMHQAAFPGEDIGDRPAPESVVPAFLRLFDRRPPAGRYRASDLLGAEVLA